VVVVAALQLEPLELVASAVAAMEDQTATVAVAG
jgi:hypothetical protein